MSEVIKKALGDPPATGDTLIPVKAGDLAEAVRAHKGATVRGPVHGRPGEETDHPDEVVLALTRATDRLPRDKEVLVRAADLQHLVELDERPPETRAEAPRTTATEVPASQPERAERSDAPHPNPPRKAGPKTG